MCDVCVMNAVKSKMLSRRDFFKSSVVAAASAAAFSATAAMPAMAAAPSKIADLTHELHQKFPTYFGVDGFFKEQKFNFAENGFNLYDLKINEHTGTHIDAPLHFSADGQSVAEIPVKNLVAPLCIIDIKAKAATNADAQVTPDDLKAWISANGAIPEGACIAMNSGWASNAASDKFRNADDKGVMHFPGFHLEATQMLLEEANVVGMAVDTLSLDYGMSQDFATHYAWLPTNRWGIECIANLDALPASGATLIVGAPKHRGGSGGPSRVMAMV